MTSKRALEGIKVAEFCWAGAGPLTIRYLALHGATVVHIESATRPDVCRAMAPYKDDRPGLNRSGYFAYYNPNKYSLALNLNHPRGPEVARRIVSWADIVAESYSPGTMKKWGLAYDDLVKIKPEIIMLSSSNQGQTGPRATQSGFGTQLTSLSGLVHLTGWPDRTPALPYGAYTDAIAPRFGATAIIGALLYRNRTGKGQYLDLSQYEAALQFLGPPILDFMANKRESKRLGNRCAYAAPHGVYPCLGDDRWVAIAVFNDEEWKAFCGALGNPGWSQDPGFATLLGRKRGEDELDKHIAEWTSNRSAEEAMMLMQGVEVAAGVVKNSMDMYADPQLEHRRHFWKLRHPEIGEHSYEELPFRLSRAPAHPVTPAPCLGEHTEYVCKRLLDMSDDEFVELLNSGAIGT